MLYHVILCYIPDAGKRRRVAAGLLSCGSEVRFLQDTPLKHLSVFLYGVYIYIYAYTIQN